MVRAKLQTAALGHTARTHNRRIADAFHAVRAVTLVLATLAHAVVAAQDDAVSPDEAAGAFSDRWVSQSLVTGNRTHVRAALAITMVRASIYAATLGEAAGPGRRLAGTRDALRPVAQVLTTLALADFARQDDAIAARETARALAPRWLAQSLVTGNRTQERNTLEYTKIMNNI
jgi:hypothetical protein